MSYLDRKDLLSADLMTRSITKEGSIKYYNTDKNVANIYMKLMAESPDGAQKEVAVDEASNYTVKIDVIKPKTNQIRTVPGVLSTDLTDETCAIWKFELGEDFTNQIGEVICQTYIKNSTQNLTMRYFAYTVEADKLTGLNAEIVTDPDLPILKELIQEVKETAQTVNNIDDVNITDTKTFSNKKIKEQFDGVDAQFNTIAKVPSITNTQDNTDEFIQWLNSIKPYEISQSPHSKKYVISRPIVINAPIGSEIKILGNIKYIGDNSEPAITYIGNNSRFYVESMKGVDNLGTGINITNTFMSDICIGSIKDFDVGLKVFGYGGGVAFCKFECREMDNNTNVLITAENIDNKIGYVNENTFHIRWINGSTAIYLNKGITQTAKFDNNSFYNIGCEQIDEYGFRLEYATRNLILSPRFERSEDATKFQQGCIVEDNECSRNIYIVNFGITGVNKLKMIGDYSNFIGDLSDQNGTKIAYQMVNGTQGNNIKFNFDGVGEIDNNTVFYKLNNNHLFENYAFAIKDKYGSIKKVGDFNTIGYQKIINENAVINKEISLIEASATQKNVIITMPKEKEIYGVFVDVNVPYKTQKISIAKSNGSISISDIGESIGLYRIFYIQDNWFVSNIGGVLSRN